MRMAAPLILVQKFLSIWDPHNQYSLAEWQTAQEQATFWKAKQTAEPEDSLHELGFTIEYKSLSVPGLWVWGRTVLADKRVYLDKEALQFLCKQSVLLPEPPVSDWLQKLVLAHELFHIIANAHKVEHSELAAIIFSFNCLWDCANCT